MSPLKAIVKTHGILNCCKRTLQRWSHTIIHNVITDRVVYHSSDSNQPDSEEACSLLYGNALSEGIGII